MLHLPPYKHLNNLLIIYNIKAVMLFHFSKNYYLISGYNFTKGEKNATDVPINEFDMINNISK